MAAPPPYPADPQQGYPPPQQGYPPQQSGYPPQQSGYPPQQSGYPPQQPGYPPQGQAYPERSPYPAQQPAAQQPPPVLQQQTAQTTVVTAQPQVVSQPHFGSYPVVVQLPDGRQVQTRLDYRMGTMTWLVCCGIFFLLFFFTGFLCPLGLIACCIDDLKDVYHLDPEGNVLGVYRRL